MKVDKITKITEGKHLNFFQAKCYRQSGPDSERNSSWEFFSRKKEISVEPDHESNPDAVCIVAFHNYGGVTRLVLIRQFRPPIRDFIYELPAGLIDPGETPEEAAKRELKEETGLDAINTISISPILYNSPGCTDESCCIVTLDCEGLITDKYLEKSEYIMPRFFDMQELKMLVDSEPAMEAKCLFSILLVLAAEKSEL